MIEDLMSYFVEKSDTYAYFEYLYGFSFRDCAIKIGKSTNPQNRIRVISRMTRTKSWRAYWIEYCNLKGMEFSPVTEKDFSVVFTIKYLQRGYSPRSGLENYERFIHYKLRQVTPRTDILLPFRTEWYPLNNVSVLNFVDVCLRDGVDIKDVISYAKINIPSPTG